MYLDKEIVNQIISFADELEKEFKESAKETLQKESDKDPSFLGREIKIYDESDPNALKIHTLTLSKDSFKIETEVENSSLVINAKFDNNSFGILYRSSMEGTMSISAEALKAANDLGLQLDPNKLGDYYFNPKRANIKANIQNVLKI